MVIENRLKEEAVIDKKIQRYTRLLIAQVTFILFNLVLFNFYLRFPSPAFLLTYTFSFALLGMVATWLMYSMIKNFSVNKRFTRLTFFSFFISFWSGIFAANPLQPLDYDSVLYITLVTINQAGSLISFATILVLMVKDIFAETHSVGYRLLGAACIYFNIGFVFSFVYGLTNVLVPNAMGLNTPADFTAYIHCINYSFYVLANVDPPYESIGGVIRSLGAIQSLLANLYIVLLIGRLLSKE